MQSVGITAGQLGYWGLQHKLYLGASHSYLRPSIDVDSAVCFSTNGAAHSVGYTNCQSAVVLAVA